MLKTFIASIVLVITSGIYQSALGEFYQYKDKDGVVIFTDDLSQVPEDQRPIIKTYESIKSPPPEDTVEDLKNTPASTQPKNQNTDFEEEKKWLVDEQYALEREREKLNQLKNEVDSSEKQESYNAKVRQLNQRIRNYKERLDQFNTKIR